MAKKTVGNLNAILSLDSSKFTSGIFTAHKGLDAFGKKLLSGTARVAKYGVALGAAALGATAALTKRQMDAIDATAKLSDRLNITTESLIAYQRAGDLAGVSNEVLSKSLEKLTRNIGEAASGDKMAADMFKRLGLNAKELATLDAGDALKKVADGMNALPNAAERMASAMDVFGRGGGVMVNFLAGGSSALAEAEKQAAKFGLSLSRIDAAQVEEANDALTDVKNVFGGIFTQLAPQVAPVITDIANRFIAWATAGEGVGAKVGGAIDLIAEKIGVAADFLQRFTLGWQVLEITALQIITTIAQAIALMERLFVGAIKTMTFGLVDIKAGSFEFAQGLTAALDEKKAAFQEAANAPAFSDRLASVTAGVSRSSRARAEAAVGSAAQPDMQMVENNKLLRQIHEALRAGPVLR